MTDVVTSHSTRVYLDKRTCLLNSVSIQLHENHDAQCNVVGKQIWEKKQKKLPIICSQWPWWHSHRKANRQQIYTWFYDLDLQMVRWELDCWKGRSRKGRAATRRERNLALYWHSQLQPMWATQIYVQYPRHNVINLNVQQAVGLRGTEGCLTFWMQHKLWYNAQLKFICHKDMCTKIHTGMSNVRNGRWLCEYYLSYI